MWWEAANDMGHDNLGLVPDEVHGSSTPAATPKPEPTPQPPAEQSEKAEETPAQPESEDPPAE